MFADFTAAAQADHHRRELLADADTFRLARLARAGRRARRRAPVRVPEPAPPRPAGVAATEQRNAGADRRYPVSR